MSGLVFYYEDNDVDVWSGRNSDLDAWNYAIKVVGDVDKVIVINKTNQVLSTFDASIDIQFVYDFPVLTGHITQIVCPWESYSKPNTSLWDFNHLTDWYVLGPAHGWSGQEIGDILLTIPQKGIAAVHSVHAITAIMFHRYKTISGF